MALTHVYIVIEYGDEFMGSYPSAYMSFSQARNVVLTKHFEALRDELIENGQEAPTNIGSLNVGLAAAAGGGGSNIPVDESATGTTEFHIARGGIRIEIVKLPVLNQTGGQRKRRLTKRKRN